MSDLPDRDGGTYAAEQKPHQIQTLWEAYQRGVLKSRDEMNLEAAIATYHSAIEAGEEPSVVAIVGAAWGVTE